MTDPSINNSSRSMKILFACSELTPWIKTGGLADVCGSLPQALSQRGIDLSIVLPGYHTVLKNIPPPEFVSLVELPLGTITLCRSTLHDTEVLLINHETFSNRPGNPYMSDSDRPWPDNEFRFALFSQAICAIAQNQASLDWQPDLVHCHDWQTGLVPALLSLDATRPATIFTIHNLAYQGNVSLKAYNQLGLPDELLIQNGLEFWGQASFIKGGIAYADKITTVSPSYAKEITSKAFGCGMEGMLQHRNEQLSGILNGIDTDTWNPATDQHIDTNYNVDSLSQKSANKAHLQKHLKLRRDPDALLFGVISRLAVQKGIDLIVDAFSELQDQNIQLAVLGSGDSELQKKLQDLALANPDKIAVEIGFNEALSHKIEAGADVFLMPSRYEPCGLNQMYSHRYGTLPLVTQVGGLADTVIDARADKSMANGFVIDSANTLSLQRGIMRAIDQFKDQSTWITLQKNAMQVNYSWTESAAQYNHLYKQTVQMHTNI